MNPEDLDSYSRSHRHPLNLLIHVATVPIVYAASIVILMAPMFSNWPAWWGVGVALLVYAALLQRFGHSRELLVAPRREGFLRRLIAWLTEQFLVFPRFLLSGRWIRNWRRSHCEH